MNALRILLIVLNTALIQLAVITVIVSMDSIWVMTIIHALVSFKNIANGSLTIQILMNVQIKMICAIKNVSMTTGHIIVIATLVISWAPTKLYAKVRRHVAKKVESFSLQMLMNAIKPMVQTFVSIFAIIQLVHITVDVILDLY